MAKNKIIVANRFDGLGERLIAILNAFYLSNICEASFKFIWNDMDEFDENVGKDKNIIFPSVPTKECFFDNDFIEKFFYNDYQELYFDHVLWWYKNRNLKDAIANLFDSKQVIQCNLAIPIDTYFTDIEPIEYRNSMCKIWNNISFSKDIKEAICYANEVAEKLGNYSALHIRGGDIVYRSDVLYLLTSIALPVHLAIEVIKYCNGKIVITGNDIGLNDELKARLDRKSENIFCSHEFFKQKNFNATQKAIFDIVLMSLSKKLYFSGHSGFSNLSYLIGSCQPMSVYDMWTIDERYSIIQTNMDEYQFDTYHQSFSCMYLYTYGRELNLPLNIQLKNIEMGMNLREDAFVYKVFFVDILLQQGKYEYAENWISSSIIDKMNLFLKDLLYEIHGVSGDYLYYFIFTSYFKIKNIEKYPILFNIACFIAYKLLKINNRTVTDDIAIFLYENLMNVELVENHDFIENKQDVIDTLSVYFVKHFKKDLSQKAKQRIQNQLSYKLGQALIINSKSVLGFLSLPFIILSIVVSHKQEQKAYKFKIKKNPKLVLPPLETYPDYKEALKEKECFTYKLGEAFIKASKNWYGGGGYIKFAFKDVPRLKREFGYKNR